jgi:hypothetical protein
MIVFRLNTFNELKVRRMKNSDSVVLTCGLRHATPPLLSYRNARAIVTRIPTPEEGAVPSVTTEKSRKTRMTNIDRKYLRRVQNS